MTKEPNKQESEDAQEPNIPGTQPQEEQPETKEEQETQIKEINVNINENKIYFEPYIEYLKEKLKTAKKLADTDIESAFLICIANLEGMSAAWEDKFDKDFKYLGLRFVTFLKEFCTLPYINGDGIRQHLWATFRCSLAHTGTIDSLFIDKLDKDAPIPLHFIGTFDVEGGESVEKILKGDYLQISPKVMFAIFENIITNFEKHIRENCEDFSKDYFTITTIKCSECSNCYPGSTKRCPFCNSEE